VCYETGTRLRCQVVSYRHSHRYSDLPRRTLTAQSHEVGRQPGPTDCAAPAGIRGCRDSPVSSVRAGVLPADRLDGPYSDRSDYPRADGVEIEEALVPAFIIEEFEDGRYTVFVPSIPTPLAGAVYILDRKRVHPLDVPFTAALRTISKWGSGSRELVATMDSEKNPVNPVKDLDRISRFTGLTR
jgi:hypothetical protein